MFIATFLICNLLNNQCVGNSFSNPFYDREICNSSAEVIRLSTLDRLPDHALIVYKCVEFPRVT